MTNTPHLECRDEIIKPSKIRTKLFIKMTKIHDNLDKGKHWNSTPLYARVQTVLYDFVMHIAIATFLIGKKYDNIQSTVLCTMKPYRLCNYTWFFFRAR